MSTNALALPHMVQPEKQEVAVNQPWRNRLKKLKAVHYKCVEYHLKGWNNKKIAAALDKTPQWVYLTLTDPKAQELIEREAVMARSRVNGMMERALDTIEDGMTAKDVKGNALHGIRLKSASMVLDLHKEQNKDADDGSLSAEDVVQQVLVNINVQAGGN